MHCSVEETNQPPARGAMTAAAGGGAKIVFAPTGNAAVTIGVISAAEPSSLTLLAAGVAGIAARQARRLQRINRLRGCNSAA